MSDLQAYFLASERTAVARERHSYAGEALKNAKIWERLAELKSQHKPAATLLEAKMTERDRLYAAAFWVVVGRMPERAKQLANTDIRSIMSNKGVTE